MNFAAMMLVVVAGAVCVVSSLGFVTSPGTPPPAFGRSSLARTASQPTSSRSTGESAVGALKIKIVLGEDENVEAALMRFRRTVSRSGHLQDLRWRRHFETTAEKKKRKKVENLRKEKIQRARDRKFRQQKF